MDWEQIEKDFIDVAIEEPIAIGSEQARHIINWFKNRIESAQIVSAEKLTEEEKSEFYTTNLTSDIKANYGK